MAENKETKRSFEIKRVKEFQFIVNESLFELDRKVRIQFQHSTSYHLDKNLVDLTLRVFYSYDETIPPTSLLIDLHVQNIFEISNLKQYLINGKEYVLPQNMIISMVSVSISHIRSLMAKNIAGTLYQNNIIPIVNPMDVTKAFYPNMFIDKKSETENNELPIKKDKIVRSKKREN